MPSLSLHKYTPDKSQLPLVQLSSSYRVESDGYMTVPLEFLLTPKGLESRSNATNSSIGNIVDALMPRPGTPLEPQLYNIKNLPPNKGLFVQSSDVVHRNGLNFVSVVCSSCLATPKFVIAADSSSTTFSGRAIKPVQNEEGIRELETVYFSFTSKTPVIRVSTAHLATEKPSGPKPTLIRYQGIAQGKGALAIEFPDGSNKTREEWRWTVENVIGYNNLIWSRNEWTLIEGVTTNNDGSVVRSTSTYEIGMFEKFIV